MLRRCTVATCAAAWRRPSGSAGLRTISLSVTLAPSLLPLRRSSGIWRTETSMRGAICRRFMLGRRSVPPAISAALAPSPARMRAASPSVRGARYSNHGSRIIALYLLAIAPFPGRRHDERCRVGHRGEMLRADAPGFARRLELERAPHLVGRDRQLVDAYADRVVDRVCDRRCHRQERPLPGFLGAERAVRIRILDQHRIDLRHVERGDALVLEERGKLVHERARELRRQT